jgi:hypothetical protein
MISLNYIPIIHSEIPIITNLTLSNINYNIEFRYNERGDFYTGIITDINTDEVLYSGKFIYANDFITIVSDSFIVTDTLVPFNIMDLTTETMSITELNKDTLDNPIRFYIIPNGTITES